MNEKKRQILFLDTGYKYHMDVTYGPKLWQLSEGFGGTVITFGDVGFHRFGGFSVHSFSILKSKLCIFVRAYRHARRLIHRGKRIGKPIDVMISYDAINTGLLGMILYWTTGVPLIVEVNGDVTSESNYADIPGATKRRFKRWLYTTIAGFVMRRAWGIKRLFDAQLDHFPNPMHPRTVIRTFPNFLDLTAFHNKGEQKRVVIIGFPFTVKGIDIAVGAFKKVAAEFPDWRLEILGWYKGADKETLDRCIGGHPQIVHVEAIVKREMPNYVATCGVALCASRTEGFPRVIKEAMYAGKPCIVSRVGGLPGTFEHGVNGLLFRSEDVDDLAAQFRRLLPDPELRAKLGAAGQQYAYKHYTNGAYLSYLRVFVDDVLRAAGKA